MNNLLPLASGAEMTALFREMNEAILHPDFQDKGTLPICETFDRDAFDALLANPECLKVRIYSAMDTSQQMRFIVVGVNDNDEDIFISEDDKSYVIEIGFRCPDSCPPSSVLNS